MPNSQFYELYYPFEKISSFLQNPSALFRLFPDEKSFKSVKVTIDELKFTIEYETKAAFHKGHLQLQFKKVAENKTVAIGEVVASGKLKERLLHHLRFIKETLMADLEIVSRYKSACLKILLSGGHGLIGRDLKRLLEALGHKVLLLSYGKSQDASVTWDPYAKKANVSDFEGFDAMIHLAGENVTKGLWTKKKKAKIYSSRIESTQFLSSLIRQLQTPPKVLIFASAVGIYGDQKDQLLDESSEEGEDFLAHVCTDWEKALNPLDRGRVIHARFGVVLAPSGGVLEKLVFPYRLGLGTVFGSGEQYMSWICIDDLGYALYHLLMDPRAKGVFNVTSPLPVTHGHFCAILAKQLHRPLLFKIPKEALMLMMGEKAQIVLNSQRAVPSRLQEIGFHFFYPKLEQTLEHVLNV